VPISPCQGMLDALPSGFAPKLTGLAMSGAFALRGQVQLDADHPEGDAVDFKMIDECRVTAVPAEIDVARFRKPFTRSVYAPDGKRVQIVSGPGTPEWVPLNAISPYMTAAVLTTEDGGFRHHRGFDLEAIRNSIRDDLRTGRFLRGASTISMQTAKNLYLEREKTFARKLQEAVLTHYLEQALTKEEILELYFNSIEFGPLIYGIGPASAHYFNTTATDLSLGQALYLSSILPNPKAQHFEPDGRVSARWMGYLRTLMRLSAKRHLIDEAELREGLSEWVAFGVPHPPRVNAVDDGLPPEGGAVPFVEGP
jgi:penicillin-binding protein 1A